jgi:hypothetical protein
MTRYRNLKIRPRRVALCAAGTLLANGVFLFKVKISRLGCESYVCETVTACLGPDAIGYPTRNGVRLPHCGREIAVAGCDAGRNFTRYLTEIVF